MNTDATADVLGWFLDDIQVYTCDTTDDQADELRGHGHAEVGAR